MSIREFEIDKDIRRASTLPARVYSDPAYFELQKERVFARSWQYAGDSTRVKAPGRVAPFTLLDGCLNEPLVLTSDDEGTTRCLSNVCTHRGAIVVEGEGHARNLRCRYHGRRFALDGKFVSMPEFDTTVGFPSEKDNLQTCLSRSSARCCSLAWHPRCPSTSGSRRCVSVCHSCPSMHSCGML